MKELFKVKFGCLVLLALLLTNCGEEVPEVEPTLLIPQMNISGVSEREGNQGDTEFSFSVTLTAAAPQVITVDYSTSSSTAVSGEDFRDASGTLTFAKGDITQTIVVLVTGDNEEEDEEQFFVSLSNAKNATISVGDAIGTIENDEGIVDNSGDGYTTPLEYAGYTLLWNDEFTGSIIDPGVYCHEEGDHGWGNEELQNYTSSSSNSFIDEGKLIIEARETSPGKYSSARIITRDKFEFTFGRVDIRAKVPTAQGVWPALWMLGGNFNEVGWPACGEIDIMELVGFAPSTVHGTAHYGPQGQSYSHNKGEHYTLAGGEKYSEKFHVFSIVWEEDRIKWYMDDQQFFTLWKGDIGSDIWRFNHEFFLILNVAVGGQWPGNPDATTTFPQQMVIDYIRVFQK